MSVAPVLPPEDIRTEQVRLVVVLILHLTALQLAAGCESEQVTTTIPNGMTATPYKNNTHTYCNNDNAS